MWKKELLDAIEESMKECIREQTGEDESENTMLWWKGFPLVNRAVEKLKSDKGFRSRALVSFWLHRRR